jgi:hypothetical protein
MNIMFTTVRTSVLRGVLELRKHTNVCLYAVDDFYCFTNWHRKYEWYCIKVAMVFPFVLCSGVRMGSAALVDVFYCAGELHCLTFCSFIRKQVLKELLI